MDIVTIDFETYYDREYSLSKITTESYIRDPRFEVIGVGVKVNDHPTDWYSGNDAGKFLKSLDYSNKAILAHHAAFDGAILSWHFGIRPAFWFDTLSMSRPKHGTTVGGSLKMLAAHYKIGEKGDEVVNALGMRRKDFGPMMLQRYGDYCVNDVELTYKLFRLMMKGFPASELRLIDQTIRMFTEPTLVLDKDILTNHMIDLETKQENLLSTVSGDADEQEVLEMIMSNEKFGRYLESLGIDPPKKTSKATGKTTWAFSKTDKAFTDLLNHDNQHVADAVAVRLGVKSTIERTRTQALLGVAERGPLPVMLNYYGAHTGRFSGGDKMNMQNLPRGGALRQSIRAPDGKVLIACDSAQIEARVLAYVAGQNDLTQAFAEGRDVYSEFASKIYGRPVSKSDKIERFVGKTCILGLGYGMGANKFKDALALGMGGISVKFTEGEAASAVRIYRDTNHKIATFWRRCSHALTNIHQGTPYTISDHVDNLVTSPDGIVLPNKLMVRYPLLTKSDDGDSYKYAGDARVFREAIKAKVTQQPLPTDKFTHIYGGKVTENIVQALARIVVSEQMTTIGARYKVVFQVHDEIVIMVNEDEADDAMAYMIHVMSQSPKWAPNLPVSCEAHMGKTFGDCK